MSTDNPQLITLPNPNLSADFGQSKVSAKNSSDTPEQPFSQLLDAKQSNAPHKSTKAPKQETSQEQQPVKVDKPKATKKTDKNEELKGKKQSKEEQPAAPISSVAQKASIQSQKQVKEVNLEKAEVVGEAKSKTEAQPSQKFNISKDGQALAAQAKQPTKVDDGKPSLGEVKEGKTKGVNPQADTKAQKAVKVINQDAKSTPLKEDAKAEPKAVKTTASNAAKLSEVSDKTANTKPIPAGAPTTPVEPQGKAAVDAEKPLKANLKSQSKTANVKPVTNAEVENVESVKPSTQASQTVANKANKLVDSEDIAALTPKEKAKAIAVANRKGSANISPAISNPTLKGAYEPVNPALNETKVLDNQLVKEFLNQIGTPSARQSVKTSSMLIKEQTTEDPKSLKAAPDGVPAPKVQNNPVSRLEASPDMGSGDFLRRDESNHKRQDAQYRQWAAEVGEVKSNAQSATQSQFIDRSVSSQLSAGVVNQILNHIERMRDSEKSRMRFIMGSEDSNRLSVEIRVVGGSIHAKFEGDESVLEDLREQWRDIKDRAASKGIQLDDPEYISYALSGNGVRHFSASDAYIEEKSQSVIQQNNQPVRPGLKTAAAESSSPVHSLA